MPKGLPGYVGNTFFPLIGPVGKTLTLAILVRLPISIPTSKSFAYAQLAHLFWTPPRIRSCVQLPHKGVLIVWAGALLVKG